MNQELLSKEKYIEELKGDIQSLKGELAENEIELAAERKKRQAVEKELVETTQYNESSENDKYDLEKKIKIMEFTLKTKSEELSQKSTKLDRLKEDYQLLENMCRDLKERKIEKGDEVKELEKEQRELKNRDKRNQKKLKMAKEEIETLNSLNSKLEQSYKDMVERLQTQSQSDKATINKLEDDYSQQGYEKDQLLVSLDDNKRELEETQQLLELKQKQLDEISRQNSTSLEIINRLEHSGKRLNLEIKSGKQKLKETMQFQLGMMNQEIFGIRTQLNEFKHFKAMFSSNMINKVSQIKEAFEAKASHLSKFSNSVEKQNEKVTELRQVIEVKQSQIENLAHQMKLKDQTNQDLIHLIEELKKSRDDIKKAFNEEVDSMKEQMKGYSNQQEARLNEKFKIKLKARQDEFEDQNEHLRHQINQLQQAYSEEKRQNESDKRQLEAEILNFRTKVKKLIDDIKKVRKQHNELKKRNIGLSEKLLITESKARTKLKSLEKENYQLKAHIQNLDDQVMGEHNLGLGRNKRSSNRIVAARGKSSSKNHHNMRRTASEKEAINFQRGLLANQESLRAKLMGQGKYGSMKVGELVKENLRDHKNEFAEEDSRISFEDSSEDEEQFGSYNRRVRKDYQSHID